MFGVKRASSRKCDELRPATFNDRHRPRGRSSALGRAAGIHDPDPTDSRHLWHVSVPVRNQVAGRKPPEQPCVSTFLPPCIMHQPDPAPLRFDDEALRQTCLQSGLVHVSAHRPDGRAQLLELREGLLGRDITGVEDELGPPNHRNTPMR
jgi:hypothetical protein